MKRHLTAINLASRKVDARYAQVILALVTLSLFVLGAGAPTAGGGAGI